MIDVDITIDRHNRVRSRSDHGIEPATHQPVPAASSFRCRANDTTEERVADFQVVVRIAVLWLLLPRCRRLPLLATRLITRVITPLPALLLLA